MNAGSAEIRFDDEGLVPCVLQDWLTGEVLTVAYMNAEALERTRQTGEVHFWSRSRQEVWHKGATSGNVQRVIELRFDCDEDSIVALVEPAGPACHTGERSCFFRELETGERPEPAPHEVLGSLERVVDSRVRERPAGSYTAELVEDPLRVGAKVREEASEVAKAGRDESEQRVAEEAADLVYHLEVLLASRGVGMADVMAVLNGRRR
jgi:phosphoribosyl-AMP cyclohydrolase / phosphoribosyl-ATP pyrophosphohydrolase